MSIRGAFLLSLALAVLAGCGDGKPTTPLPKLYPVKGTVVKDGNPVSTGTLRFAPTNDTPESRDLVISTSVGSGGVFELSTLHALSQKKESGVPAGEYRVIYMAPMGDQATGAGPPPEPITLPAPITVKAEPNNFTFDLGAK